MTKLDDVLVPKVQDLLTRFGASATLARVSRTYTPATGGVVESVTNYSVKVTPPTPNDYEYVAGDVARVGDMSTLMAVGSAVPQLADRLTLGSNVWQVVKVIEVRSGEQVCAYQMELKR